MKCLGLALEWEKIDALRERARTEKKILLHSVADKYCKPNRENAVTNSMVILPVLRRLGKAPKQRLPHLDDLQPEVQALMVKCTLPVGDKAPYKASMEIKKLAGFVKRRANRREVTKDRNPNAKPKKIWWDWGQLLLYIGLIYLVTCIQCIQNLFWNKSGCEVFGNLQVHPSYTWQDPEFHELLLAFDPDMKDFGVVCNPSTESKHRWYYCFSMIRGCSLNCRFNPFCESDIQGTLGVTFAQEVIDAYLASCRRVPKGSSSSLGEDEDEEEGEDGEDDAETQEEFNEFKKWLDEKVPDAPKRAPIFWEKCGQLPCVCFLVVRNLFMLNWQHKFENDFNSELKKLSSSSLKGLLQFIPKVSQETPVHSQGAENKARRAKDALRQKVLARIAELKKASFSETLFLALQVFYGYVRGHGSHTVKRVVQNISKYHIIIPGKYRI